MALVRVDFLHGCFFLEPRLAVNNRLVRPSNPEKVATSLNENERKLLIAARDDV